MSNGIEDFIAVESGFFVGVTFLDIKWISMAQLYNDTYPIDGFIEMEFISINNGYTMIYPNSFIDLPRWNHQPARPARP